MCDDFYPSDEYESDQVAIPSVRYTTTGDVLNDRTMSTEDKRALLASWTSDLRVIENFPALRRLDDGSELHIDHILEALKALDTNAERQVWQSDVLSFPSHRLDRSTRRYRSDDDDDPPPASLAMGLPEPRPEMEATPSSRLAYHRRPSADVA